MEPPRGATSGSAVCSVCRGGAGGPKTPGGKAPGNCHHHGRDRAEVLVVQGKIEGSVWGRFEDGAGQSADGNSSQRDTFSQSRFDSAASSRLPAPAQHLSTSWALTQMILQARAPFLSILSTL